MSDAKNAIDHERKLRMYAEQRHQETIKQQLLELKIAKASQELEIRKAEDEARARIHDVCMLSLAEQQHQAMQLYQPPPPPPPPPMMAIGHHHHHPTHHHHHQSARDRHYEEMAERRHRREHHICSKCGNRGHYSKSCRVAPPSRMLGPAGPPVRGYLEPARGTSTLGYSTDDEEWGMVDEYYDDDVDEHGYPIGPTMANEDGGVLVYYEGGAAPGTALPKSSVRHVIGV